MRMVITTGPLEEGAHHVSEEVYKKVMLLLMQEIKPQLSRPKYKSLVKKFFEETDFLCHSTQYEARTVQEFAEWLDNQAVAGRSEAYADTVVDKLYAWSDQYKKNTFRFWISHVIYNAVKDILCLLRVRRL